MSIVIQNMGPVEDADDLWNYELRINRDVVGTFVHRRADGLAACLLAAALAAPTANGMSKSMIRRIAIQKGIK